MSKEEVLKNDNLWKSHEQSYNKRSAIKKQIDRARRDSLNLNKYAADIKALEDIVETLKAMKPLYQDLNYKNGWNDCIYLVNRAFKKYRHEKTKP